VVSRQPPAALCFPNQQAGTQAVELFIIHCTTCKARLKVQHESVIGDILACPKCSSMVHVVPPIGWKRSTGPQAALEESAIQPPPSEISKPLPAKVKAAAVAPPLPVRRDPALNPSDVQPHAVAQSIASPVSPMPLAGAPARIANPFWAAAAARVTRDWKLYGGGSAVGVLLGIAGLWLAVGTADVAPPAVSEDTSPARQTVAQAAPASRPMNPPPVVREEIVALKPSTVDEAAYRDPQPTPGAADETNERAATRLSHESSVVAPTVAQAAATNESAEVRSKPGGPALKLDPAPSRNFATNPPTSDRAAEPPTADATAGADEPAKVPSMAAIDPASAVTPASEGIGRSRSAAQIEERLASTALPSVQFVQAPLVQFVEFIGDLAGLRITIDDEALAAVGKGRQSPLSIKLAKTTAGKALSTGLKSLGLTLVARNGKLVVTTPQGRTADQ
jgi:hypothetical protein